MMNLTTLPLLKQVSREVSHRVIHRDEAHGYHRDEDDRHIRIVHAERIGVDNERATGLAHADNSELLLQPAQQQTESCADNSADNGDETAFNEEYLPYQTVRCSKIPQCPDIVLLIDDEHRERTDDVEAGYDKDEREEDIGDNLLNLHYAERVLLLLEPVFHDILVAADAADFLLHRLDVRTLFQAQGEACNLALAEEQVACEGY